MNTMFRNSGILLSTLILAACGSDDHHSDDHDEHAHSLMISQQSTTALSFLEEGSAESLAQAAADTGAQLLLSSTGEQAAVITSGQVQFVSAHHEEDSTEEESTEEAHSDEEHELPELSDTVVTATNPLVINTNGHFSVLADGHTQFVPFETLGTPEVLNLGTETYPGLLLEETATELVVLTFNGTSMTATEIGETNTSLNSENCAVVNSVAQSADFAVVSCDDANFIVSLDESGEDHVVYIEPLMDESLSQAVQWKTAAGVFVGLGADNQYYVLEKDELNALALIDGAGFAAPAGLCSDAWALDSLAADILALTATHVIVLDHEGGSDSIQLDQSPNTTTCEDLHMATASQAVFVLDNNGAVAYEIDKEDGATEYHIHGRESLSVNDVTSVVSFHEAGEEGHDHSHE